MFFKETFGFDESEDDVYKYITVEETEDGTIMKDKANNKTWNSGIFKTVGINDIPKHEARGGGKLHIIKGNGSRSTKYWLVDVLPAQSHPENDGATYQAASNFNALEFTSPNQTARDGISSYPYDRTQGPYCALACTPSILYRNYFVQVPGSKRPGQLTKEIELLENTPIHVTHGYAEITDTKSLRNENFDFSDLTKYKVASHSNCEVTLTSGASGLEVFEPEDGKKHIAHHVYAAAFNFSYSVEKNAYTLKIAESLLEAQYRATILCAWDNSVKYPGREGSNKLYLTLLGGGVFGNPKSLICKQIEKCQDLIVESGLDVYVVCFNNYTFQEVYPLLGDVMKETGGSVIDT